MADSADALAGAEGLAGVGATSAARRTRNGGAEPRRATRKRSRLRPLALILGALLIVAAVVLVVKSVSGSSGTNKSATTSASSATHASSTHHAKPRTKAHTGTAAPTTAPAETVVDVLNGTNTTGLAHRIAGELQKSGYSQATALAGRPSGSNQASVVQYAGGHQADAQAVAHSLSVSQVQPLEGSVGALAPAASVVVIVGLDRASAGGGEESSGGATAVP
ncbi:MAG TPA: LytR C-terminal domain-containing protein [Solirubrobacteraceae bacterium]|nr:LytR C-terminal domain-containing protein [Solirubrobacteraceae bacterium]